MNNADDIPLNIFDVQGMESPINQRKEEAKVETRPLLSVSRNEESNEKSCETDFFIPLHRNHILFQSCVEAIVTFYYPRTIYIATSIPEIEKLKKCVPLWKTQKTNLCFLEEECFFTTTYQLSKEDIKKWYTYKDHRSREFGWWYQQVLKLGAAKVIPLISDPFIVWDSDVITIKKWPIYPTTLVPFFQFALLQEKERSLFNKIQYTSSLRYLLKLPEIFPEETKGTFVPHHFVFHHKVIDKYIEHVEDNHVSSQSNTKRKTWIEVIVSLSNNYYRFSEYKNIATFMSYFFPELLYYHPYNEYGENGIRIREKGEADGFVEGILRKKVDTSENTISYDDFCAFVVDHNKKKGHHLLPSYIQVEHL